MTAADDTGAETAGAEAGVDATGADEAGADEAGAVATGAELSGAEETGTAVELEPVMAATSEEDGTTEPVTEIVVWWVCTVEMTLGAVRTVVTPPVVRVWPTGQVVTVSWTTSVT